ncbi:MAG TPA: hypothetical protein VMT20_01185 [Terriglobia bacterium]|nr:hypothetical protein [Terriglobia bacterium]
MKRVILWSFSVLAVATLVIEWTRPSPACGPFYFPPVFAGTRSPDSPLGPYTRGRLGVLQPGYDRIYLYAAYRNLAGRSFDRAQALALWGIPPESAYLLDELPKPGRAPPVVSPPPEPEDWGRFWIDARNKVPNTGHLPYLWEWPLPEGIDRIDSNPAQPWVSYLNCPPQAFRTAIETLRDRTQKYTLGSAELAAWVTAQDQVFSNCHQGKTIPAPLAADAAPLARSDRQYQIAAAYFYAGDFDKAIAAFQTIADDSASPWSPTAKYLVARVYIRQATVGHDGNSPDPVALAKAEAQLKQVLADPKSTEFHASASALLDDVEVRLHPDQRARQLAEALMAPNLTPAELSQKVRHYTFLLDKLENERFATFNSGELQNNRRTLYPKLADLRAHDDLTDWILTFQVDDPSALDHAYEKWQQTNSSAWLVAAISKVQPGDARAPKLIQAAEAVRPSTPACTSVTFHRFRLMAQDGQRATVLPELNRLLAHDAGSLPRSALNLFLALRMTYAKNLAEFLKYAQRVPLEADYDGYAASEFASIHPPEGNPWFDSDALIVLNQQMPAGVLTEVARSKVLPVYLRREVARGAWTRAFLLGEDQAALKLAPVLGTLAPELRPDLDALMGAATQEARRFAGTLLILRFPGLRPYITSPERDTPTNVIDNLRENWWDTGSPCGVPWNRYGWMVFEGAPQATIQWPSLEPSLAEIYPKSEVPPPSFLSRAEVNKAQVEWKQTLALPVASIVLGQWAIDWVHKHPDDPRAAEALALTVRAGHFGCANKDRWKTSKAAFELLHLRYPESSWAKQTPYWYR